MLSIRIICTLHLLIRFSAAIFHAQTDSFTKLGNSNIFYVWLFELSFSYEYAYSFSTEIGGSSQQPMMISYVDVYQVWYMYCKASINDILDKEIYF